LARRVERTVEFLTGWAGMDRALEFGTVPAVGHT
jgi:hypothetical protein